MMQNSENFYINSQSQLNRVVDLIKETKLVALDTEFTRETTYYPILSIVQVALKKTAQPQQLFIIDCLADLDLSQFFALIAEEKISKVLHSSAQDLQIFHHKSDLMPQGVFDTQVMANFCGFDFSAGYSNLVEKLFSTVLDKKQQRSDWQIRPLSNKLITRC
jgi:ribonuclease D